MRENSYDPLSAWYDTVALRSHDYAQIAQRVASHVPSNKHVLELGVGTGLLAQKMTDLGYDVTGVDFSEEMIDIARYRLTDTVALATLDVRDMSFAASFDAAVSHNGVWNFTQDLDGQLHLDSHLMSLEDNIKALHRVVAALKDRALLLVNVETAGMRKSIKLPNGAEYVEQTEYRLPLIRKNASIKKAKQVLARQYNNLLRLTEQEKNTMFASCGLIDAGSSMYGDFVVLQKRAQGKKAA